MMKEGRFGELHSLLAGFPHLWDTKDKESGGSLLHYAAIGGECPLIIKGLAAGLDPDLHSEQEQTPLMWACMRGQTGVMRLLIEAKANASAQDAKGVTPLLYSIQHKHMNAFMLLLALKPHNEILDCEDSNGCGPVHWAAYQGEADILRLLKLLGRNFSHVDNAKNTALHRAAQAGHVDVVQVLLDAGVDIKGQNAEGATCLEVAQRYQGARCRADIAQILRAFIIANPAMMGVQSGDLEAAVSEAEARQTKESKVMGGRVSPSLLQIFEQLIHHPLAILWLVFIFISAFAFMLDIQSVALSQAPVITMIYLLSFMGTLGLSYVVLTTDPGKVYADADPHTQLLTVLRGFREGMDQSRLCTTTWVIKSLRTKYSPRSECCIQEYDHFCEFLGCSIGRNNHKPFLILMMTEGLRQLSLMYLCWLVVRDNPFPSIWMLHRWALGVCLQSPLLGFVASFQCGTLPFVAQQTGLHCILIMSNLLTCEFIGRLRYEHFWHGEQSVPGKVKHFCNPFDKGSGWDNMIDYWVSKRSEPGPKCPAKVRQQVAALRAMGAQ